jgi:hypothetical protein
MPQLQRIGPTCLFGHRQFAIKAPINVIVGIVGGGGGGGGIAYGGYGGQDGAPGGIVYGNMTLLANVLFNVSPGAGGASTNGWGIYGGNGGNPGAYGTSSTFNGWTAVGGRGGDGGSSVHGPYGNATTQPAVSGATYTGTGPYATPYSTLYAGGAGCCSTAVGSNGYIIIASPSPAILTTGSPSVSSNGVSTVYTFTNTGTITF